MSFVKLVILKGEGAGSGGEGIAMGKFERPLVVT